MRRDDERDVAIPIDDVDELNPPDALEEMAIGPGAALSAPADPARDRRDLAHAAGCLSLAEDAAAGTRNGIEAMLAHQLAAAHTVAMKLAGRAAMHAGRADRAHRQRFRPEWEAHETGLKHAADSAARMMAAFQRGALALDRLRHGNRYAITVRRVDGADRG